MAGLTRTTTTPAGFDFQPGGRSSTLDKIYVGFVKAVDDKQRMGRLKVWIPELGGTASDSGSWLTVSYASPFAGATNLYANTNGSQFQDSQRSYGMWFVPPDLENEVLCCFVNGDPGRGIWFACLYQEFMNHMVPGLPGNNTSAGVPVGEYNKMNTNQDTTSPNRPVYAPLADQLATQGLSKDPVRGTSTSGARRNNPINSVYGTLTPGGSQIVFDDNPSNRFIRLRTQNGAQILINDTNGFIYLNSRDGNNWIEMDADGAIDIYAKADISIRSEGNMNIRADLDLNLEAGRSMFIKARNDPDVPLGGSGGGLIKMNANTAIHMTSDGGISMSSDGNFNRTAGGSILDRADEGGHYKAGTGIYIQADAEDVDIKGAGEIHLTSTNIHLNGIFAEDAESASDAEEPQDLQQKDVQVVSDGNVNIIVRNTILYRLPSHEPYEYHGGSTSGYNGHVEEADPKVTEDLRLVRQGEIVSNQSKPNDIIGSPRAGMPPGKYSGQGYDDKGNPTYKYEGGSADLQPAGSLKTSDAGVQFIKKGEGLRKTTYLDIAGLKTIGYGHLLTKDELAGNYVTIGGKRVMLDRALTDAEVDQLLRQDIETKAEKFVRSAVKVNLTQSQFDALVSLCFNIGGGAFGKSSLVASINANKFEEAPEGFLKWCKARVRGELTVVKGLLNRRQAEALMFQGKPVTNH
jgi:GH24 family phage-related lysozyme (muramidase)